MVAPRAPRQMFMPPVVTAAGPTTPANMFTGPLQRPRRDFDWASLLQGIGAGLLTGRNIGEGLGQGLIYAREFGDQRADNEYRQRREDREEAEYQYQIGKDQKAAEKEAATLAQFNATIDGMQIPENQKAFLKAMGPGSASYEDLFPGAQGPQSSQGKLAADLAAGLIDQPTYDALLRKDTYIAPVGGAPDGTWERYVDPETGRAGQRNTRTGKIDWDPGNTMLTQVGVDPNGNPVYDLISGSPGPTKEHEVKAANASVLLDQGLGELERLYASPDVSAWRIAGADQAFEAGPLGNVIGQQVMTSADKQFVSGRARALESLANTITGAAFTEQQKQHFQAMLPQATDDAETAKIKIRQAKEYLASLKQNAKVSNQTPDAPKAGDVQDGYQFMGGDPADPKNWIKLPDR